LHARAREERHLNGRDGSDHTDWRRLNTVPSSLIRDELSGVIKPAFDLCAHEDGGQIQNGTSRTIAAQLNCNRGHKADKDASP
jgi:hypothetical protein